MKLYYDYNYEKIITLFKKDINFNFIKFNNFKIIFSYKKSEFYYTYKTFRLYANKKLNICYQSKTEKDIILENYLSQNDKENLIKDYINKLSLTKIINKYNLENNNQIYYILEHYNISKNNSVTGRLRIIKKFFEKNEDYLFIKFENNIITYKHISCNHISNKEYYYFLFNFKCDNTKCSALKRRITMGKMGLKYGNSDKAKQTCLDKYGVEHYTKTKEYKADIKNKYKNTDLLKKRKQTNLERYGDKNYYNEEKRKQTNLDKYGVEYYSQTKEHLIEREKTCLKRYGVKNQMKNKKIQNKVKQTLRKRYGVEYYFKSKEHKEKYKDLNFVKKIQEKIYQTKKKNNSFNTSKPEKELFIFLKKYFPDIRSQYKSKNYPFNCDYYIPGINLYIELNLHWTHGNESYIGLKQHLEIIEKWKSKKTKYYKNAINVWSKSDVKKRETAKLNNLNYLEIFNYKDFNDILKQIGQIINGLKYEYNELEQEKEFKLLKSKSGDYTRNTNTNKIVISNQYKEFYKKEINLYKTDYILRRFMIENRCKYLFKKEYELTDKELLRGFKISGKHIGFSHFSPYWIKAFIEEFNIKSIYDPCGGWGHRLVGVMASICELYIYNDTNNNVMNNCKNIYNSFENNVKVEFYNNDANNFILKNKVESIFTCPPYYNIEIYEGQNTSINNYSEYNDWLNVWWRNVIKCGKKSITKYFTFVINNKYKKDMKNICIEENLNFLKEIPLGKNNLNHFQRTAQKINKGEYLLIFSV